MKATASAAIFSAAVCLDAYVWAIAAGFAGGPKVGYRTIMLRADIGYVWAAVAVVAIWSFLRWFRAEKAERKKTVHAISAALPLVLLVTWAGLCACGRVVSYEYILTIPYGTVIG